MTERCFKWRSRQVQKLPREYVMNEWEAAGEVWHGIESTTVMEDEGLWNKEPNR